MLVARVGDTRQRLGRFVHQTAHAFLIQRAGVFLVAVFLQSESVDCHVCSFRDRRTQTFRKFFNCTPYRRRFEPRDPNVYEMLVQATGPGRFALRTGLRFVLEALSNVRMEIASDIRECLKGFCFAEQFHRGVFAARLRRRF